ncbi:Uncharacterized protein Rs2_02769 [Raphanus sativus]|nr:Uncharacterized protein Rs2_02769 [Raphanus sativus]
MVCLNSCLPLSTLSKEFQPLELKTEKGLYIKDEEWGVPVHDDKYVASSTTILLSAALFELSRTNILSNIVVRIHSKPTDWKAKTSNLILANIINNQRRELKAQLTRIHTTLAHHCSTASTPRYKCNQVQVLPEMAYALAFHLAELVDVRF